MIQGFDHAVLNVSDLPRAVAFYGEVLGFRSVDNRDSTTASYCWLNFGAGQTLSLTLAPERTPKALGLETDLYTSAHLAFTAPEAFLKTLQGHLEANGVSFHRSSTGLYFSDPDGNFLEVAWWREKGLRDAGAEHW